MTTGLVASVQRFATPEQLAKVREYVQDQRNREFVKGTLQVRSKPLGQIARELDMPEAIVREAMLDCGWYQAMIDAENAPQEAAPAPTKMNTKAAKVKASVIPDPEGWDE